MIPTFPEGSSTPLSPSSTVALTQFAITSPATFTAPTSPLEAPRLFVRHLRDEFEEEFESEA